MSVRLRGALSLALLTTVTPAAAGTISSVNMWVKEGPAEIVVFDPQSKLIFAAGGGAVAYDQLGNQVANYGEVTDCAIRPCFLSNTTSIAVRNGLVAISDEVRTIDDTNSSFFNPVVKLFDIPGPRLDTFMTQPGGVDNQRNVADSVAFTPDGQRIVAVHEGERDAGLGTGVGFIAVVDVASGAIQRAGFAQFDTPAQRARLIAEGGLIADAQSLDVQLEPENIAITNDGTTAYVTIQEQNLLAKVDLTGPAPVVTALTGVGFIDRGQEGFGFDPVDDGQGVVKTYANVISAREPDGIAIVEKNGKRYIITADEGDGGPSFTLNQEDADPPFASGLVFVGGPEDVDPARFPDAAALFAGDLGGLDLEGRDLDGDGDADQLVTSAGRSISVFDEDGKLIFNSGDKIERALIRAGVFRDDRSDNNGPEPEGLTIGRVGTRDYLFVSLERERAVAVFDITDPEKPRLDNILTSGVPTEFREPEGLAFISAADSFDGGSYLLVAAEDRGQLFLQRLVVPAPGALALFGLAAAGLFSARRRRGGRGGR